MKTPLRPAFLQGRIIGFSLAESEELLALGYGREHQREVLLAIARGVLRAGGDLCYGGHLQAQNSFTLDLLDLSSAEQRAAGSSGKIHLGRLYNPLPWDAYDSLSIADEARWIDCYTPVRVRPEDAGIEPSPAAEELTEEQQHERKAVQVAAVLNRMREMMIAGFPVPKQFGGKRSIDAAILLGGKVATATGLCPGLIEEGVRALQARKPVYLLGGFGGVARVLAQALDAGSAKGAAKILDAAFDRFERGANFATLRRGFAHTPLPVGTPQPSALRKAAHKVVAAGRANLARTLANGLSAAENRVLFQSIDALETASLVLAGMRKVWKR